MTQLVSYVISLSLGVLYGLFFIKYSHNTPYSIEKKYSNFFKTIQLLALRIILIGILWRTLHHSQTSEVIIAVCLFILGFWITVFKKKAYYRER